MCPPLFGRGEILQLTKGKRQFLGFVLGTQKVTMHQRDAVLSLGTFSAVISMCPPLSLG